MEKIIKKIKFGSRHDKFFRRIYSKPRYARDLVILALKPLEKKLCDLKKLKVERSGRADLVLSIPLKGDKSKNIKLVILFEHKSRYDKGTFKQSLMYQTDFYVDSKETVGIVAALFYHGKQPWKGGLSFQENLFGEDLSKIPSTFRKDMLNYNIRLILASAWRKLNRRFLRSKAALRLLDEIWDLKGDEKKAQAILLELFRDFAGDDDSLFAAADYVRSAGFKKSLWDKAERLAKLKGILKPNQGGYMNAQEEVWHDGQAKGYKKGYKRGQLEGVKQGEIQGLKLGIKQGETQGYKQGQLEEARRLVLNMLKENTKIPYIAKVTGLSEKEIKKMKNGS